MINNIYVNVVDIFAQNMHNTCALRIKIATKHFNGQQVIGTLKEIMEIMISHDEATPASLIINGTEYCGNVKLLKEYLRHAKIKSEILRSGMIAPIYRTFL